MGHNEHSPHLFPHPAPAQSPSNRPTPKAPPPATTCQNEPTVVFHPLARHTGGGLAVRMGTSAWIVVDPALSDRERRCVLAHERAHLTRGPLITDPGTHPAWQAVVAREEHLVDQQAASHLVPEDELARIVNNWLQEGTPVEVWRVAEAFAVTPHFAQVALAGLARRPSAAHQVL